MEVNFYLVKGEGGAVTFVNDELWWSFPFFLSPEDQENRTLGDLKFVRVAFPRYLERRPYLYRSELITNDEVYVLERAEDINKIAFTTLEDRMVRELAGALLRLTVKQAMEHQVRRKNEEVGALVSVVTSLSEKADTRNWQTLPYEIAYARVPLKPGVNTVELMVYPPDNVPLREEFDFMVEEGQTLFYVYHSLESLPLGQPLDCYN